MRFSKSFTKTEIYYPVYYRRWVNAGLYSSVLREFLFLCLQIWWPERAHHVFSQDTQSALTTRKTPAERSFFLEKVKI